MKKLYSYFLVSRYDRTDFLKETFEIKDIDGEEFVYFSKNKIQLFSQIPVNEFIYCEYQGTNGYRMLSLVDYPTEELKPLFLAKILPERQRLLRELSQKLANASESTQMLICNPIKIL